MAYPVRVIAPTAQPITLAQAKAQVRVDFADEDALISALIEAATDHVDGWTGVLGRALMTQTWELSLDKFPKGAINLPLGPCRQIVAVTYVAANGSTQTVSSADYTTDLNPVEGWVIPKTTGWPTTMETANAVTVRWVAGYATAADVPAGLKQAILLLVAHWYQNRELIGQGQALPFTVSALLAPYKRAAF
jgi:uncharacterized phiE125 gp8 family phage protein